MGLCQEYVLILSSERSFLHIGFDNCNHWDYYYSPMVCSFHIKTVKSLAFYITNSYCYRFANYVFDNVPFHCQHELGANKSKYLIAEFC